MSLILAFSFSSQVLAFYDGPPSQVEVVNGQECPPVAGGEDKYIDGNLFPRPIYKMGKQVDEKTMKICLLKSSITDWYYTNFPCDEDYIEVSTEGTTGYGDGFRRCQPKN